MVNPNADMVGLRTQYEQTLHNAVLITEMAMELKDRSHRAEKYVNHLRNLSIRASRVISTMHNSAKTFTLLSQKLATTAFRHLDSLPNSDPSIQALKSDYERLVAVLDKELSDVDDVESIDASLNNDANNLSSTSISERLRSLETKQGFYERSQSLPRVGSARSFRSGEVDEKYPENLSRDSLIDLNNVVNLPPVPEDIFTGLCKPVRTSSLSSLKSIRKVKLYLQRAANSEDEESEYDDHELSISDDPMSGSDGGEIVRVASASVKKGSGLCNIKEETPQDA